MRLRVDSCEQTNPRRQRGCARRGVRNDRLLIAAAALAALGAVQCKRESAPAKRERQAAASASAQPVVQAAVEPSCPRFERGSEVGRVESEQLHEASGLVASARSPGVLWSHNDSGDRPRLFAIDRTGRQLGTFVLGSATAQDWEALAIGAGPDAASSYLYVADNGGNIRSRNAVTIYRVAEPLVDRDNAPGDSTIATVGTLVVRYPEGRNHDSEAIFIDPRTAALYLLTKSDKQPSLLYRTPLPRGQAEPELVFAQVLTLTFGESAIMGSDRVTDMSISSAGDAILIRTYTDAYYWSRNSTQSVEQALAAQPCKVPLHFEPQGETIAFAPGGNGYYTLSEGSNQPIYWFERLP